jgi:hypothetical protein
VPFDPDVIWGKKPRHHVTGTVGPCSFRGPLKPLADGSHALAPGPAWARDSGMRAGTVVAVALTPEGPQREALDDDIAEALAAEPKAAAFFDGLAQFYRRAYLTWIAGTKRRPDERVRRIQEMVRLLNAGIKQRR